MFVMKLRHYHDVSKLRVLQANRSVLFFKHMFWDFTEFLPILGQIDLHYFTHFNFIHSISLNLQASMHSKKWSLLQELTRDIHTHSNKAQVLAELASCIATGKYIQPLFTCQKCRFQCLILLYYLEQMSFNNGITQSFYCLQ